MHTNIGLHFEDVGFAVTDIHKTLKNLANNGFDKVAATGLGIFTQYEQVKDTVSELQGKNPDFKMEIIPAIKCYFEDENHTLCFIAKDYEGYKSLCKMITKSNEFGTLIASESKKLTQNKPIITLKILQEYAKKGHLLLTTSDETGYFSKELTKQYLLQQDTQELKKALDHIEIPPYGAFSYSDLSLIIQHWQYNKSIKKPTKASINSAEKYFKKTNDRSLLNVLENQIAQYEIAHAFVERYENLVTIAKKTIKEYESLQDDYMKLTEELHNLSNVKEQSIQMYQSLCDILGADNVCIELQYHGKEIEKEIIKELIQFGTEVNGQFVIGNSTRIGTTKQAEDLQEEILRLTIAHYDANREEGLTNLDHPEEYCIKTEDDLKQSFQPILSTILPESETFLEAAIQNTEKKMDECLIIEPEQPNHYPQFCEDENATFIELCQKGIAWRFPNRFPNQEYEKRLQHEIQIITSMGYAGYHLIVQDYLQYGRLLGYLDEEEVANAPLSIDELEKYLKDNNVPHYGVGIGPGRGSAAGSLCCYLLGITDLDPIRNGLIFERFLNPERVSMPDIDSDFRPQVRLKAREYVTHKYGEQNVCEIVTKAYQGPSGCMHIAARYIAAKQNMTITDEAIKTFNNKHWDAVANKLSKKFQAYIEDDYELFKKDNQSQLSEEEHQILDYIPILNGLFTGYSQHAAGVIISKDNISDEIPLMWNQSSQSMQTQCAMASAEAKGYLKMDFLGLRNLTTISNAVKHNVNPNDRTDICLDVNKRDTQMLSDPAVYKKIFSTGMTQGVFQFESLGMKQMLKNFQPESFEDIVLLVAAYRPGPLNYIPEMIAQKWYRKDPEHYISRISKIYPESSYPNLYPTPKSTLSLNNATLQSILAPTYGCPIYQEQIMQIFQQMAGYSLGRADEVRRAMSKKKEEKLRHETENFIYGNQKEIEQAKEKLEALKNELATEQNISKREKLQAEIHQFKIPDEIEGCIKKQGITEKEAMDLFNGMIDFAKYGFNKSHAAAYAVVAVETAWLKLYRTLDFYISALNNWKKRDELPAYAAEMAQFTNIKILPPSLYHKDNIFTAENGNIRFPIKKAKNMQIDMNTIVPATSLQEFIAKNPKVSNTKLKKLIELGCFNQCWYFSNDKFQQYEIYRTNHSVKAMKQWVDENYDTIYKYYNLKSLIKSDTSKQKDFDAIKDILNQKVLCDFPKGQPIVPVAHTNLDILEERNTEYDLTNHVFSMEKDLKIIRGYRNQNTFKTLQDTTEESLPIPVTIVSLGSSRTTKNGKEFIPVTLMDRDGRIAIRRFPISIEGELKGIGTNQASHKLYGIMNLTKSEYFLNQFKMVKDYPKPQQSTTIDYSDSLLQESFQQNNPMIEHQEKYYGEELER